MMNLGGLGFFYCNCQHNAEMHFLKNNIS
uniref:Uncharacterized protein n=1 Tax=Anguilla anguilla TaxID=7936 RepID=A0A0E9RAW8_ANGAN